MGNLQRSSTTGNLLKHDATGNLMNVCCCALPEYLGSVKFKYDIVYDDSPYPPGSDGHGEVLVPNTASAQPGYKNWYSIQYYPARYVRFYCSDAGVWSFQWYTNGTSLGVVIVTPSFRVSDGYPTANTVMLHVSPPQPLGWGTGTCTLSVGPNAY